jgi:hypothetical protein
LRIKKREGKRAVASCWAAGWAVERRKRGRERVGVLGFFSKSFQTHFQTFETLNSFQNLNSFPKFSKHFFKKNFHTNKQNHAFKS